MRMKSNCALWVLLSSWLPWGKIKTYFGLKVLVFSHCCSVGHHLYSREVKFIFFCFHFIEKQKSSLPFNPTGTKVPCPCHIHPYLLYIYLRCGLPGLFLVQCPKHTEFGTGRFRVKVTPGSVTLGNFFILSGPSFFIKSIVLEQCSPDFRD